MTFSLTHATSDYSLSRSLAQLESDSPLFTETAMESDFVYPIGLSEFLFDTCPYLKSILAHVGLIQEKYSGPQFCGAVSCMILL